MYFSRVWMQRRIYIRASVRPCLFKTTKNVLTDVDIKIEKRIDLNSKISKDTKFEMVDES